MVEAKGWRYATPAQPWIAARIRATVLFGSSQPHRRPDPPNHSEMASASPWHRLGQSIPVSNSPDTSGGVAAYAGGLLVLIEPSVGTPSILAVPPVLLGLAALPGQSIQAIVMAIIGGLARLRKIRTFYALATGIGVVGFALIVVPGQFNLLLDRKYGLDALERGIVESLIWLGSLVSLPIAGRVFGRKFREDPDSVVRIMGTLIMARPRRKTLGLLILGLALAQALLAVAMIIAAFILAFARLFRRRSPADRVARPSLILGPPGARSGAVRRVRRGTSRRAGGGPKDRSRR